MFDDIKPQTSAPQPSPVQSKEPVDMFGSVNTGGVPNTPPKMPLASAALTPTRSGRHTMRAVIVALAIVVVLGVIGYVAAQFLFSSTKDETQTKQPAGYVEFNGAVEPSDPIVPNEQVANEQISNPTPVPESTPVVDANLDTDLDGLTDSLEGTIGTNIASNDTDGDGLLDAEEVNIYLTNPAVADTDGDTFTDGQEVANGYNPNGPGKLFQ